MTLEEKQPVPEAFGGYTKPALPWTPLPYMEEYLENLVIDERAPNYIRAVRAGLAHFATWAKANGIDHPDDIDRRNLLRFQAHLTTTTNNESDKPLTQSYRQQIMKYNRGWVNWLAEVGHIDSNPWVRIRIGATKKKPKPLENDEIELLFSAHRQQAFAIPPFFYHRREVILMLLYAWGLRIHELQSLSVAQMDMHLDWVTARNKGGGEKVLPYGDEMKTYIMRWLTHRGKFAKRGEDALLIDQSGKRLSSSMIYRIVTQCGARAGITINPHRLRDTFGTTMLDHDVEVERIMKMMGHTQRSQTLAYSRVNDHKVKESHDRVMTPLLDKLLGGEVPR